jgi:acyl-coenzyme A thioesterase PaaI-like protein
VRGEGKVVHLGSRVATAEAHLVDREGALYAHGTSTCLISSSGPGSSGAGGA